MVTLILIPRYTSTTWNRKTNLGKYNLNPKIQYQSKSEFLNNMAAAVLSGSLQLGALILHYF